MNTVIKPIKPLGLPSGSIRALLALTLVGVTVYQLLTEANINLLLSEAIIIILAHYFAARRSVNLSAEQLAQLTKTHVEPEAQPLWLPRGSVRVLILLAFVSTGLVLLLQGRLFITNAFSTLGMIFAYLAGVSMHWWRQRRPPSIKRTFLQHVWVHLQGLGVLFACVLIALFTVAGTGDLPLWFEQSLLALILFYFGAR